MVSKAFESLVKRRFSDSPNLKRLASDYQTDYPELNREEGVSFNPLPARLTDIGVRIGLSEGEITEILTVTRESSLTKIEYVKKLPPKLASVWVIDALRHFKMSGLETKFAEMIFSIPTCNHPMIIKTKEQYAKILL